MAGIKETPRQKMIGMMYLVLTALLALQVSSAVIYKFQALNNSLEKSVVKTQKENFVKVAGIHDQVAKRGSKERDVLLMERANKTAKEADKIISYIDSIKNDLIEISGGYDDNGNLVGAKEETDVEVLMIGSENKGKAYELEKKLDDFVNYMNQNSTVQFAEIATSGTEDPFFKNNKDQKNKDFAELNFGQTPVAAALAVLSEFQVRICRMESQVLSQIAASIEMKDFPIDELHAMVTTPTKYVPAGTKYEANLFVAAASSKIKPEMSVNNGSVEVDSRGFGAVSFMAEGGNFGPDGIIKKTWTGKIKMKRADGSDTVMSVSEEYFVTKPAMEISSRAVDALYRNCKNELNVRVPALGSNYNPEFSVTNAELIKENSSGGVSIIPRGHKAKLTVKSNGLHIGEKVFEVRSVPVPSIQISINGKTNPLKTGVSLSDLRNIMIKALPDKDFERLLPNESEYKVIEFNVFLKRGRSSAVPPVKFNQPIGSLSNIRQSAKENDILLIEVVKVVRKNFKEQWEEVDMPDENTLISIPVFR